MGSRIKRIWKSWTAVPLALVLVGSGLMSDAAGFSDKNVVTLVGIGLPVVAAVFLIIGTVWSSSQLIGKAELEGQLAALRESLTAIEGRLGVSKPDSQCPEVGQE